MINLNNVVIAVLWLLWAVFLFGGFIFGNWNIEKSHRIPRPMRMLASFTLVIASVFILVSHMAAEWTTILAWLAVGMFLGFIGDLAMARLLPVKDYVIAGMVAFGLGHIAYIAAILQLSQQLNKVLDSNIQLLTVVAMYIFVFICWYFLFFRPIEKRELLHYLVLPYALLLGTTAGLALGIGLQQTHFLALGIGALLFLLSDLILGLQLFNGLSFRGVGDVVWLLYSPGQMLIVFSPIIALLLTNAAV